MVGIHHVEIWISNLAHDLAEWSWLLTQLGCELESEWPEGQSWSVGGAYITFTTSPNTVGTSHNRRRPGVNHIAFSVESTERADAIMENAPQHGWSPLYADRYPHAGGPEHYAGWLENSAGFKAEVVADTARRNIEEPR